MGGGGGSGMAALVLDPLVTRGHWRPETAVMLTRTLFSEVDPWFPDFEKFLMCI